MKRNYTARAFHTWAADSGSAIPHSVVAHFTSTDKASVLAWCRDVVLQHGARGLADQSVSFIECWSDDPDDAWKLYASADSDGMTLIMDQLGEVAA